MNEFVCVCVCGFLWYTFENLLVFLNERKNRKESDDRIKITH